MRENILVRIELQAKWLQGLKYEEHWLLDVLWGQPIKLTQVASTSELS